MDDAEAPKLAVAGATFVVFGLVSCIFVALSLAAAAE
jgi:hypothetical protein